ncbi:MAG: prephenate dehydrogenase [Chryseotalea sp.]
MTIGIIGLGLIGGSMAIDLKNALDTIRLIGYDANEHHRTKALALGLVDHVVENPEALSACHVIILAIPVNHIPAVAVHMLDVCSDNTIILDAGSTKGALCKAIAQHPKRKNVVAAHPIDGTENSGHEAELEKLFAVKTNIICEKEKSSAEALQQALLVFDTLGMHTIYMDAEEHDKHVAYVSHLSHVSSFLLGLTVLDIEKDEKNIATLSGSGFASTVRLAKSSPDMWAPIFEQNMEYLSQALQEYIIHLQRFQYHLLKRDRTELHKTMQEANAIRRILQGIENKNQK